MVFFSITIRIQILLSFNNVLNFNIPAAVTVTIHLVFLLSLDLQKHNSVIATSTVMP